MLQITELSSHLLLNIFTFLGGKPDAKDLRAILCACKAWQAIGSENVVWQPAIKIVFDLENCVAPEVVSSPEAASPSSPSTSDAASSTSATSSEQRQGKDGEVKPAAEVEKTESSETTTTSAPPTASLRVQPQKDYYHAFQAWERLRVMYHLPPGQFHASLWLRVSALWDKLEGWYKQHLPSIAGTLGGGATPEEWESLMTSLWPNGVEHPHNVPLSLLRYLMARHNGQELDAKDSFPYVSSEEDSQMANIFRGMFGGYSAYDHLVVTKLYSLKTMNENTMKLRKIRFVSGTEVVFAGDYKGSRFMVLDTVSGNVRVLSRNGIQPCAPPGDDALLVWLEEFASRLVQGGYRAEDIVPGADFSRGVSLFPASGETVTRAVTRGIEVVASSIYMAEHRQGWTYSIRIRLLTPGEEGYMSPEERGFTTAQLRSRHWEIRDNARGDVSHVRGAGVIGKYPLLREGGWRDDEQDSTDGQVIAGDEMEGTFVYQSCSGPLGNGAGGSFGGELEFVPGTLRRPEGPIFPVRVETFPLQVPDFIY